MNASFARAVLSVTLALSGISILNVAGAPRTLFPIILFSVAVSLSFVRGFIRSLPSVIAIGLLSDAAALGRIGILAAFSVGLAYTASFFSRRFSTEHGFLTHVSAGILVGLGGVAFGLLSASVSDTVSWASVSDAFGWSTIVVQVGWGILIYPAVSAVMRGLEERLSYLEPQHSF